MSEKPASRQLSRAWAMTLKSLVLRLWFTPACSVGRLASFLRLGKASTFQCALRHASLPQALGEQLARVRGQTVGDFDRSVSRFEAAAQHAFFDASVQAPPVSRPAIDHLLRVEAVDEGRVGAIYSFHHDRQVESSVQLARPGAGKWRHSRRYIRSRRHDANIRGQGRKRFGGRRVARWRAVRLAGANARAALEQILRSRCAGRRERATGTYDEIQLLCGPGGEENRILDRQAEGTAALGGD